MNNDFEKSSGSSVCPAIGYQDVSVCVPVTVKPFGDVGKVKTQCLGKPIISPLCETCAGEPCGVCKFTISQKLRVEVPIAFGAIAEVGEFSVDCEGDKNCDDHHGKQS